MIRKVVIITSMVAAIGIGVLWILSYGVNQAKSRQPAVGWLFSYELTHRDWYSFELRGERGQCRVMLRTNIICVYGDPGGWKLEFGSVRIANNAYGLSVIGQFWLLLAITLIGPCWAAFRHHRSKRQWQRLGLCIGCGYDLRGTESGVCSECGEIVAEYRRLPHS